MKTIVLLLLSFHLCSAAFVLVSQTTGTGGTTSAINSTGANLLTGMLADGNAAVPSAFSDSNGNTWHSLGTTQGNGVTPGTITLYYAYDKAGAALVVGAGHTASWTSFFPIVSFAAWSGSLSGHVDPIDTSTAFGPASNATTVQPGSITPSASGALLITGMAAEADTGTYSIDSGFTILAQSPFTPGTNFGGGFAYIVETAIAAKNPTWTIGSAQPLVAAMAAFKAEPSAGRPTTQGIVF